MGLFKKKFRMEHVYAGPEPANKHKGEYEMRDVYAGPNQPSYPLNNAAPITPMQTVYAAPDAFQRMLRADMENSEVIVPKGMASPGMPGSVCESGNADVEIIDCPECGEKTRHYKFCEYCGAILK